MKLTLDCLLSNKYIVRRWYMSKSTVSNSIKKMVDQCVITKCITTHSLCYTVKNITFLNVRIWTHTI